MYSNPGTQTGGGGGCTVSQTDLTRVIKVSSVAQASEDQTSKEILSCTIHGLSGRRNLTLVSNVCETV